MNQQRRAGFSLPQRVFIALLLIVSCLFPANASAGEALKGVALVIGQSAYKTLAPLPNAVHDAHGIENLLAKLGFETDIATDENTRKLRRSLDGFIQDAEGADVALIYYSGHAIEAGGVNYLIPTDADLSSLAAADETFESLQDILEQLRGKVRITILLLDACRSNPFPREALLRRNASSEGAPILASGLGALRGGVILEDSSPSDTIGEVIGYAAEPGHAALDGPAGTNSPYAAALLKHLSANAGYDFGQVMTMVTEEVYLSTQARQRPWINASLRWILAFGGKVEEASTDDSLIEGERRKLLLTIAATPQEMRSFVEALAREQNLPLDPLYGMLKELKVDTSAGPQDLDKQLRAGADNLRKLLAEKVTALRQDPELVRLAGLGDRAQSKGLIALAKDYRAKAAIRADNLDEMLDQREAEVKADRLELASTYADYAATAILAFDFKTAAEQYAKAYRQADGYDSGLSLRYRIWEADALNNHGDYKGDNDALKAAIEAYKATFVLSPRASDPHNWATTQNNLGIALLRLGERESGTARLEEALAAFRASLEERPRERAPLDWAQTQTNLGTALRTLGERESGTARLDEAVAAYRAALEEQTKESSPLDWALTQNNLGNALFRLGERESGTARLDEAVAAYRAALEERTREQAPLDWAMTQDSLGNSLQTLGQRESGTARLKEAVAAYRAALEESTRERVPLQWAKIQNDLGNALRTLGERESGTARLEEAVAAYRAALEESTRERVPLDWAKVQNDLGTALRALGARESGTARLKEAVAAYRAALEERTRQRVPLQWVMTEDNLGIVLLILGVRTHSKELIGEAKRAVQLAREGYRSEGISRYDAYLADRVARIDAELAKLDPPTGPGKR